MRIVPALAAALLVALTPAVAFACPVCLAGEDPNRTAFFLSFLLLSLLPLVGFGGLILYLRKRARELEPADELIQKTPRVRT